MIVSLLLILCGSALVVITLTAVLNTLTFLRLSHNAKPTQTPPLSILIPARNEAAVIGETLASLLAQTYPNFEIILLDDHSQDETAEIARAFDDSRLQVIQGQPLPPHWLGKNWACHQLAQVATGQYLIFTDADVRWTPGALETLAAELHRTNADLLTVWPTQHTVTWAERLIVPLMALAIVGYLPVLATHYLPFSIFAAACGQCMAWKRTAYLKIGGHRMVARNVLEDVTMARYVKRAGLRLRMIDGAGVIVCRMYDGWRSVRNGYAKNILAGYGNSIPLLLLATVFHWLLFIVPPVWLALLLIAPETFDLQITHSRPWAVGLTTLGIGVRMLTADATRQRMLDALWMPLSAALMTVIAAQAMYWRFVGGSWKGRAITPIQGQDTNKKRRAIWQVWRKQNH
jgi:chlorobactene glucosyltransferase